MSQPMVPLGEMFLRIWRLTGLEEWMLSQEREDLKELVPKLLCHKLPEVCFVPDHYGQ